MTRLALILAALTIPAACDLPSGSTGDAPADSSSSGGDGYVCDDAGAPCDLDAPACAPGLRCLERTDAAGGVSGVCAARCNLEIGVTAEPCKIGWCDVQNGAATGMCRDDDGLPTGLCDGVPSCAGDHCTDGCANGLACIAGACAFACETAADCAAGQACLAGACFDGDGLADPCN